jgi:hypothetical protein
VLIGQTLWYSALAAYEAAFSTLRDGSLPGRRRF